MKQTTIFLTGFIAIFIISLTITTGCSKDKQILQDTAWEIESVKVHTDSIWQYPEEPICWEDEFVLRFNNRNKFFFVACSGNVRFSTNQKISFKVSQCLAVGGYSDLALECYTMINTQITYYELSEKVFILKGENGEIINLKKME